MECNITNLNSGFNGTGISLMISMEKISNTLVSDKFDSAKTKHTLGSQRSDITASDSFYTFDQKEKTVLNRFLVNVGDSAQRFCNENRIKLMNISCIVITSLSPHNISGFPGIFLSLSDLGVGEITVVGPSGIKRYIDIMTPFINRKYPALKIIEIDTSNSQSNLHLKINYFRLDFFPITLPASSQVIAIAVKFAALSSNIFEPALAAVIPLAGYFEVTPSVR